MAGTRKTVKELAQEAKIDIDEALIALWDAGYDEVVGPNHVFRRRETNRARRAIGIVTQRELRSFTYWIKLLKLKDDSELRALLCKKGVSTGDKARKLQPKAISRLKGEARKLGIDPITGTMSKMVIRPKKREPAAFKWRPPGHQQELRWLNEEEVRNIHFILVEDFSLRADPIVPAGVQSESLLASAVFRPQTTLGGILKYPTVETSAAALLHSITHDHPFHNGNKRTALVSTLVFLDKNGFFPEFDEDEAFKLVMKLAQHQIVNFEQQYLADREVLAVAQWLDARCRPIEKGERPISFRKLRNILTSYNCKFDSPAGGKVKITLAIKEQRKSWSIRSRVRELRTQVHYSDEGRDFPITSIQKIRKDLHLNDQHGVDSRAFYDKEPMMATDFIARYRKTLDRLAKF
ncbi:MAG: type II toxin-antitoxin system death-on-curing family toxin [Phycisphaerae bacterium]